MKRIDDRLVELEIGLTHQQELLSQLNGVVTEQTRQLMRIETTIRELKSQQDQLRERVRDQQGSVPQEKPPHY